MRREDLKKIRWKVYVGVVFSSNRAQDRFKGKWFIWELIPGNANGKVIKWDREREVGHKRYTFEKFTMEYKSSCHLGNSRSQCGTCAPRVTPPEGKRSWGIYAPALLLLVISWLVNINSLALYLPCGVGRVSSSGQGKPSDKKCKCWCWKLGIGTEIIKPGSCGQGTDSSLCCKVLCGEGRWRQQSWAYL